MSRTLAGKRSKHKIFTAYRLNPFILPLFIALCSNIWCDIVISGDTFISTKPQSN